VHRLRERVFVAPFVRELEFPFVPHVTLLSEGDPGAIVRARAALAAYSTTVAVDRVHLLEEVDRIWRPVADAVLAGPAVIGRGSLPLELTESEELDPEARAFAEREWKVLDEARLGPGTRWERHPFALTARRERRVIGVATGWTGLGVAYLSELMIAAGHRGEGIGSHLLAAFEALATRKGCSRLALRTDADSLAPEFYAARGWAVEATFREWLGGLDFVQLRRDL
jgi:GNAT superfamily N-acetyltransferase